MATAANIHREMTAAWNRRDFDTMHGLTHPEFTYTGPDGREIPGTEAATDISKMFTAAFPDAVMQINRVFTDGDTAIAETAVAGTQRGEFMGILPTGKRVELRVCNIREMKDGKVYRMREYLDFMTMMVQLGVMKMPGVAAAPAHAG